MILSMLSIYSLDNYPSLWVIFIHFGSFLFSLACFCTVLLISYQVKFLLLTFSKQYVFPCHVFLSFFLLYFCSSLAAVKKFSRVIWIVQECSRLGLINYPTESVNFVCKVLVVSINDIFLKNWGQGWGLCIIYGSGNVSELSIFLYIRLNGCLYFVVRDLAPFFTVLTAWISSYVKQENKSDIFW
jgi:hypothetical protein